MELNTFKFILQLLILLYLLFVIQNYLHFISSTGNNYLEWVGPQPQLLITDAELIKEILIDKENVYPKMKLPAFFKKILGDGLLLTADGEKWTKMRKIYNPAFQMERLIVRLCNFHNLFYYIFRYPNENYR